MVSDVSLEMHSDSINYVGLQDDEITEPVHTIKLACACIGSLFVWNSQAIPKIIMEL